jgi:hypothetical protein
VRKVKCLWQGRRCAWLIAIHRCISSAWRVI